MVHDSYRTHRADSGRHFHVSQIACSAVSYIHWRQNTVVIVQHPKKQNRHMPAFLPAGLHTHTHLLLSLAHTLPAVTSVTCAHTHTFISHTFCACKQTFITSTNTCTRISHYILYLHTHTKSWVSLNIMWSFCSLSPNVLIVECTSQWEAQL